MSILCITVSFSQTGPAGFSNAATNILWLRADSGVTVSSGVSLWSDQSGNGHNASQGTSTDRFTFSTNQLNGFPTLDSDGTNNYMTVSGLSVDSLKATGFTFAIVFKNTNNDYRDLFSIGTSGSNYISIFTNGETFVINEDGARQREQSIISQDTWHFVIVTRTAAGAYTLTLNGTERTLTTIGNTGYTPTGTDLTFGTYINQSSRPFAGSIAEYIIFDKKLESVENIILNNYLANKYDLTLNSITDYHDQEDEYFYDIAGIGRDTNDIIIETASSDIIRIENNNIATSNSYNILGHNNGSLEYSIKAENAASTGPVLNRIWAINGLLPSVAGPRIYVDSASYHWPELESLYPGRVNYRVNLLENLNTSISSIRRRTISSTTHNAQFPTFYLEELNDDSRYLTITADLPGLNVINKLEVESVTATKITLGVNTYDQIENPPDGYVVLHQEGVTNFQSTFLSDYTKYSVGDTVGLTTVAYIGPDTSIVINTVNSATNNSFRVYNFVGFLDSNLINFSNRADLIDVKTPADRPSDSPTNLSFSNITSDTLQISFDAASSLPDYYLALRRLGSDVTTNPEKYMTYNLGDTLGNSIVAYKGSSTSFSDHGLVANSDYYYKIYSFNGEEGFENYRVSGPPPLSGNTTTESISEPSAQATNLIFSNVEANAMDLTFTAATPNSSYTIAFRRNGAAVTDIPDDLTVYSVGDTVGNSVIAFIGSSNSFSDLTLSAGTNYHYALYSFNDMLSPDYLTTSPLRNNQQTTFFEPTAAPTNISFSPVSASSFRVSFDASSPSSSGYIILQQSGSAVSDIPADFTEYSIGDSIGTARVAYLGSSTSNILINNLSEQTTFHFAIFSFNSSGLNSNFLTNPKLTGSQSTPAVQPTDNPSNFSSTVGVTSFSAASSSPDGYLVLRREGAPVEDTPEDLAVYSENTFINSSRIVYIGTSTSFINKYSFLAGRTYYYSIYAYNGSNPYRNYRQNSPLLGSFANITNEPNSQVTSLTLSNVDENKVVVNFTSPNKTLLLRRTNSASTDFPMDTIQYFPGDSIGNSRVIFSDNGSSFTDSISTPGTDLHYRAFSYKGISAPNYFLSSPLDTNVVTPNLEPTDIVNNVSYSSINSTNLRISYNAASPKPDNYLILNRASQAVEDIPVDLTAYSIGDSIGSARVVYVGPDTNNIYINNLSEASMQHFSIFSFNGSGLFNNYLTSSSKDVSRKTPATQPSSHPTDLQFTGIFNDSLHLSFTASSPAADNYIVLRRISTAVSNTPQTYQSYSIADSIGSSHVAYVGPLTSFGDSDLEPDSIYYYKVFAFNGPNGFENYRTGGVLSGSQETVSEPIDRVNAMTFSNVSTTSVTISFNASNPAPDNYIIIHKKNSLTEIPQDYTEYTVGDSIGGARVVYIGAAPNNALISDLQIGSNQRFTAFPFNGSGISSNYLTNPKQNFLVKTKAEQPADNPSNLVFTDILDNTMTLSFTSASSSPDKYLVLRRASTDVLDNPVDLTTYSRGQIIGDSRIAYSGADTTFIDTGRSENTVYYYKVYSFNGASSFENYNETSPLQGSQTTFTQPSAAATNAVFTNLTENALTLSFTAASPAPDSYLIIRRAGGSTSATPVDLTVYSPGDSIGNAEVLYKGPNLSINETGLQPGTNYGYRIYSYNNEVYPNYLSSPSLSAVQETSFAEPSSLASNMQFSQVGQNDTLVAILKTMDEANPEVDGYLVLYRQDSAVTDIPVDFSDYEKDDIIGNSCVLYSGISTSNFSITNLRRGKKHFFAVFSYNGYNEFKNYLTSSSYEAIFNAPVANPINNTSNLVFSNASLDSINISFTSADPEPEGFIVLRRTDRSVQNNALDTITYLVNDSIGTSKVVHIGTDTSFTDINFEAGKRYHYRVQVFNGNGVFTNYSHNGHLTGNHATDIAEPTAQATNITFSNVSTNSFDVNYTAASPSTDSYLVLRRLNNANSDLPVHQTEYSIGDSIALSEVAYVGNETSFTESSLPDTNLFHYTIYSFNGTSAPNYYTSSATSSSIQLNVSEPLESPSNFSFIKPFSFSLELSYDHPDSIPDNYLILNRVDLAVADIPDDFTFYSIGDSIGASKVMYVGPGNSNVKLNGLLAGRIQHYAIFSMNQLGSYTNYLTSSSLTGSVNTPDSIPTENPTNFVFSNITADSIDISFTAADPSPENYIVLRRDSINVDDKTPKKFIAYALADSIGSAVVVYNGPNLAFKDRGLQANTNYIYRAFSYNGAENFQHYKGSSPLTDSTRTLTESEPLAQATNLIFSEIEDSSVKLSYTAASPNSEFILFLRQKDSLSIEVPSDLTSYSIGDSIGLSQVAYIGSATSFVDSNLTRYTDYYYSAFSFNGTTESNYLTVNPLIANVKTILAEPVASPTDISFGSQSENSVRISYINADPIPDGYIVLHRENAPVEDLPKDSLIYSLADSIASSKVVYIGTDNSNIFISNLNPSTVQHFSVFSYNSEDSAINYLTSSALTGITNTAGAEPAADPKNIIFSDVFTSSARISFTDAAVLPTGYVVLRRTGTGISNIPNNLITYSIGDSIGASHVAYVGSDTTFQEINLTENTNYYYRIVAFNGNSGFENYSNNGNLNGNFTTVNGPSYKIIPLVGPLLINDDDSDLDALSFVIDYPSGFTLTSINFENSGNGNLEGLNQLRLFQNSNLSPIGTIANPSLSLSMTGISATISNGDTLTLRANFGTISSSGDYQFIISSAANIANGKSSNFPDFPLNGRLMDHTQYYTIAVNNPSAGATPVNNARIAMGHFSISETNKLLSLTIKNRVSSGTVDQNDIDSLYLYIGTEEPELSASPFAFAELNGENGGEAVFNLDSISTENNNFYLTYKLSDNINTNNRIGISIDTLVMVDSMSNNENFPKMFLSDISLPVKILSFETDASFEEINFKIVTASEDNASFLELYRVVESDELSIANIKLKGNPSSGYTYQITDKELEFNKEYSYKLYEREINGKINLINGDISVKTLKPEDYIINEAYPNPFNPKTTIEYLIPNKSDVNISIYNLLGKKVYSKHLINIPAASYEFTWDAHNLNAKELSSSVYYIVFKFLDHERNKTFRFVKKVILVK